MAQRNAKKTGPATVATQRHLARAVGRDPSAINRWLKDPRWPFSKSGPWDPAKVKAWANRTLAEDPAADTRIGVRAAGPSIEQLGPERQLKVALNMEKLEAAKLARGIKAGDYHRVDECMAHRVGQIRRVIEQLDGLASSLPALLVGKTAAEMGPIIQERIYAMRRYLIAEGPNPLAK